MAIYLKLDNIQGSVTSQNHAGWISLDHVEFTGISTQVNMTVGKKQDRLQNAPKFGEIILRKQTDKSSIAIFEHATNGRVIRQADIVYVTTGHSMQTYAKYVLTDVLISHYSEAKFAADNAPSEIISLHYNTIEKTFIPRDEKNQLGSPLTTGYHLPNAQPL